MKHTVMFELSAWVDWFVRQTYYPISCGKHDLLLLIFLFLHHFSLFPLSFLLKKFHLFLFCFSLFFFFIVCMHFYFFLVLVFQKLFSHFPPLIKPHFTCSVSPLLIYSITCLHVHFLFWKVKLNFNFFWLVISHFGETIDWKHFKLL